MANGAAIRADAAPIPTEERFRELEEDIYSTWKPNWWNESRRITLLRGLTEGNTTAGKCVRPVASRLVFGTKRLPEWIKRDRSPRWDAICPVLPASLNGCHCKSWNCFMPIRWTLDLTSPVWYDFQLLWKLWAVPTQSSHAGSATEGKTKINQRSHWSGTTDLFGRQLLLRGY